MSQPYVMGTTVLGNFSLIDDTGLLYPVTAIPIGDVGESTLVVGTGSANAFQFIDQTGAPIACQGQPAGAATGPNVLTVERSLNTNLVSTTDGTQVLAVAQPAA